jgi:hypothetical protein
MDEVGVQSIARVAEGSTSGMVLGSRDHGCRHGMEYPGYLGDPVDREGELASPGQRALAEKAIDARLPAWLQTDADD